MNSGTANAEAWANEYKRERALGLDLTVPSETLVRLFKGDYVPGMPKDFSGMTALDVSCGDGHNTFFLCRLGLDVHATEIHEDICVDIRSKAAALGYKLDVQAGTNLSLPFERDRFDFLVSWNVLHYEQTEDDIRAAIAEYCRVLKPGGRVLLSTTGPEHKILEGARTVGAHLYEIGREDDFRKGERFFYFDAPNYLRYYLDPWFDEVLVGRTHDHLFTATLDWWLAVGRKRG